MAQGEERSAPETYGGISQTIKDMPLGRRLSLLGAGALLAAGFVVLMLWINQPDYQVLYSGLTQRDGASVVSKLKELKIPYQLESGGSLIKVPSDKVYETRLALAGAGLPRGQGVGFEVFNQVKMGTTEFVQKINYQRALQGELARTIASFREVEEARVHIVMPRESLFVEQEKKPTAGVVLRLAAGRRLGRRQIAGVVHLVASAVPGLNQEGVTVVDTSGNLLFKKSADTPDFAAGLTANQLEHQRNLERSLKAKVQSMLEQVLGAGRAVVRVAADLDFTRTVTNQETFNPDQVAVRSETRSNQSSRDAGGGPRGSPDQRFSLAARNATPGQASASGSSNQERETTNYEISRTRRQVVLAAGSVKRLSVAVVVDGPYKVTTGKEGQKVRTFTPRSPEQMRQIGEIVRQAVGYNQKRGDQVTVANVPFALAPTDVGTPASKGWLDYARDFSKPALNLVLVVLFFLLVVRPLLRQVLAKRQPGAPAGRPLRVGPGEELPPGVEPEGLAAPLMPKPIGVRDQIMAVVQQDPDRATTAIRAWIQGTE